jgi:thiamine-monophosphate kinase
LSAAARRALVAEPALWTNVLGGGDDYELVIAVPPRKRNALLAAARAADVPVTEIGHFERGRGTQLMVAGRSIRAARQGYVHF